MSKLRPAVALVACVLVASVATATPAKATRTVTYQPPVDAPITDPYRPPATPYGPGNRGIEYGTAFGAPVRAAADGVVTFAGAVAGARYVTLRHADGLRTTVGPLQDIAVAAGQHVSAAEGLGTAAGRVLFTARRGSTYLDPASLFGGGAARVRLVADRTRLH
ncbi:MAG: M23 family metallopeptidase [Acidimicrobiales bacterium]